MARSRANPQIKYFFLPWLSHPSIFGSHWEPLLLINPLGNVAECAGNPGANLTNRAWRFIFTRVSWSQWGCFSLWQELSVNCRSLAASLQQWKMSPALPSVSWDWKLLMHTDTWGGIWFSVDPDINRANYFERSLNCLGYMVTARTVCVLL